MSEDLTARVADLATLIDDHTVEDEETAERATGGEWISAIAFVMSDSTRIAEADAVRTAMHMARHDPDRALRRVKAVRDLVAEILAEPHADAEADSARSCSQVLDPRAGKPCDCGRDARVARLLGIIASEWEDTP